MKYCYWLKYNNYANRVLKIENNLQGYKGVGDANVIYRQDDMKNWNPNDGITTTVKLGEWKPDAQPLELDAEPDYFITVDDEYGTIDSRWFVIENKRLRKGQWLCVLKRDVFAEAWNDLLDATCNIDRALLSKYSKLIFNQEPISVNQIITEETEIKDKTGCPWIVFYGNATPSPVQVSIGYNFFASTPDIAEFCSNNSYKYLPEDEGDIQMKLIYIPEQDLGIRELYMLPYGYQGTISGPVGATPFTKFKRRINITNPDTIADYTASFKTQYTLKGSSDRSATEAYNNQIVKDTGTQKYYRIRVEDTDYVDSSQISTAGFLAEAKYILSHNTDAEYVTGYSADDLSVTNVGTCYRYKTVTTTYTEVSAATIDAQVPAASVQPADTPYYIWAMPYGNITVTNRVGTTDTTVTTDKDINLSIAMRFSAANTGTKTFDFQILPFCPLPDGFINPNGSIYIDNDSNITDNNTIKISGVTKGFIFSIPRASFTRQIMLDEAITIDDPKLRNITDLYRLNSPNYASAFEFSVAKNNGLTGFNVRCTYMPINPYIRVAPIWGGLYGTYFEEDVRGLVCGGDYSLARIADAWVNYQEQNKNFELIFNRQIENMDVMRKYGRIEDITKAGLGVVGGAATGAMLGGAPGAIVGAAGSAATGGADIALSELKFRESKSYATDMHELNLGNIQAMPRTLARTTAFNIDNRYFPILTCYRCSSDEIQAVVNYIMNRSMTVGVIGNPRDYVNNTWSWSVFEGRGFIQGSIININTKYDTHFIDELNKEFQMGVYLR